MRHDQDPLSKNERPLLRRLAFMVGMCAVRSDGLYRVECQAMRVQNSGRKRPAVVAMGRRMLCPMREGQTAQLTRNASPGIRERGT